MKVIVYSSQPSPRVEYIFSTLLAAIGFGEVVVTNNETFYKGITTLKFNYSKERISHNEVWVLPCNLLFEKGCRQQSIEFFEWNCLTCFFYSGEGDMPFDIFAASFYLLSRYEEYLPHSKDMYGRYAHEDSIAFKKGFLHIPLVNLWLLELKKIILTKFPSLQCSGPPFKFIPTYDIDIAWSYAHKGFVRNTGGLIKDLFTGKWASVKNRLLTLCNKKPDLFDCYEWLHKLHQSYNVQPIYFFLVSEKNKGYDKNILPGKVALKQLIKEHAARYGAGIHPSWQSGDDDEILNNEIALLKTITGKNIYKSRQHYIRMLLPDTYRKLLAAGITDDYSMGYGSINGFRASYCLPYKWYDLEKEKTTQLTVHPFCFMDANSFYEQHLTAAQAQDEMKYYLKTVQQVNGELITIWHNHFLGTDKLFEGWRTIYQSFIEGFEI